MTSRSPAILQSLVGGSSLAEFARTSAPVVVEVRVHHQQFALGVGTVARCTADGAEHNPRANPRAGSRPELACRPLRYPGRARTCRDQLLQTGLQQTPPKATPRLLASSRPTPYRWKSVNFGSTSSICLRMRLLQAYDVALGDAFGDRGGTLTCRYDKGHHYDSDLTDAVGDHLNAVSVQRQSLAPGGGSYWSGQQPR